jgi:lipopolysaccharide transport system ATP-binding protein
MEVVAVDVRNLSKNYSLNSSQFGRLRHFLAPGRSPSEEGLWALRDVSFTVERGEAFGIIGANGSGKSTLLQIIAGILRPTAGTAEVNGRLSALLELGSGFSPEFTGRDNVYLNGSLLGLTHEEIDARFADIERFAGIGSFISQPIRTYSTGMVLRLAFAVAAHVDPEILIVDEALAVGDISFRQRCMRKIHDLRARGVTILFVSHETSDVKALCERCLWLQNGSVQQLGEADSVVAEYLRATLQREITHKEVAQPAHSHIPAPEDSSVPLRNVFLGARWGDGRATILGAALVGTLQPLERAMIRLRFRVNVPLTGTIAGFLVRNHKGESIFGSNSARENYPLPVLAAGEITSVDFHWEAPDLAPGTYTISLGIADGNLEEYSMCDYIEDAITTTCAGGRVSRGYFQLRCTSVAIHRN